ncbi:MAG: hypothetical protein RL030_2757 [Pseudomonadota bacterium]|jgi:hypothetical protein
MTITPVLLSGSTNGRQIKVVATTTPGTTIHTAGAGTGGFDEVWLYATNSDTVSRKLTIEFGGATSPDDLIEVTIPPESGPFCVVPGIRVTGTVAIAAFAAAANVVLISGNVNRYTP